MKTSSLSVRIYAVGLLQIAVVLVGFAAMVRWQRPAPPNELRAQELALADAIEQELDRPHVVRRLLERARAEHQLTGEVVDASGLTLASTIEDGDEVCDRVLDGDRPRGPRGQGALPGRHGAQGRPHPGGPPPGGPPPGSPRTFCYAMSLGAGSDVGGKLVLRRTMPGATSPFAPSIIVLTLITVALTSWLLTRSLVRPLRGLGDAARALGQGELDARTGIERADEFGDVARAFDTMASRVTNLVRGERELIANISHEFRTPLARIRVALDLGTEASSADDVRESLRDIVEDLDELEQLVSDVLESARPVLEQPGAPGTPALRRRSVDIDTLLAASVERFGRLYPARTLKVSKAGLIGALLGDPMLLRRMLDNLLDNAHKFSPDRDTTVRLSAAVDGEQLVVDICDAGVGISEQDIGRVFKPFFRADPSRTRATGGTGLGLGLARRIAQAHGGRLELDSTLGEGTRVRVRLPLADLPA